MHTIKQGQKFGEWTVVKESERRNSKRTFDVVCSCGNQKNVFIDNIIRGKSLSCGECRKDRHQKTYSCWVNFRNRCTNKNHSQYPDYGGRGISFCQRWSNYDNFLSDMGEAPQGTSLDRIDNDGNYEPSNCQWTDVKSQNTNKRNILVFTGPDGEYVGAGSAMKAWGLNNRATVYKWCKGHTSGGKFYLPKKGYGFRPLYGD